MSILEAKERLMATQGLAVCLPSPVLGFEPQPLAGGVQ